MLGPLKRGNRLRIGMSSAVLAGVVVGYVLTAGEPPPAGLAVTTRAPVMAGERVEAVILVGVGERLLDARVDRAQWVLTPFASVDLPSGTVLAPWMLRGDKPVGGSSRALVSVAVDASLWPLPGPGVGAEAVFAAEGGGCALAVLRILGVDGDRLVVGADPETVTRISTARPVVFEVPSSGWPFCDGTGEAG
jgi:hypothetical protein